MTPQASRRQCIALLLMAAGWRPAVAAEPLSIFRLGIVSLLGNSIRIYAREKRDVLFNDVGMDDIVIDVAGRAVQAAQPQAEIRRLRSPVADMDVDAQIEIGNAAGRAGTLPDWLLQAARDAGLSHLLLVTSDNGPMEFRTGKSQVVGNGRVNGVGFWVGADYRWTNDSTGVHHSGYLAPFVQLRITLLDMDGPRVLDSKRLSEGYAAGPAVSEAPNPWDFLDRKQKAAALQGLLRSNVARGTRAVLEAT